MMKVAKFPSNDQINIEGLAISNDKVYLANRGNSFENLLFTFSKKDFFNYLLRETRPLPKIEVTKIIAPKIGKHQSTLSGLDYISNNNSLVFTTSIELTENAYHDGLVLGSFIGLIPISELTNNVNLEQFSNIMFNNKGIIPTKAESITITEDKNNELHAVVVSDNDNGVSELFKITYFK